MVSGQMLPIQLSVFDDVQYDTFDGHFDGCILAYIHNVQRWNILAPTAVLPEVWSLAPGTGHPTSECHIKL